MVQDNVKNRIQARQAERRSSSFCLSVVLFVSVVLRFYVSAIWPEEGTFFSSYLAPFLSAVPLIAAFLLLIVRNIRISYSALLLFLGLFGFLCLSCFINKSGVEHGIGLLSLLVGMYLFHADPMRKRGERKIAFWLFLLGTLLILANGVPGAASLDLPDNKFNPNGCAFFLAMLYCICLTRFFPTRAKRYIVGALLCFLLQFVYISRTALLGEVVFTFCVLVCRAWKKNRYSPRTVFWVIAVFSVLGIVLAWLYAEVLYPAVGRGKLFVFGKDIFTGRQEIWGYTFSSVREHFWFGVGSRLNEAEYLAGSGFGRLVMNAHNSPLGTLAAYGIFAFVLFYLAFARLAAQPYRKQANEKPNRLPAIFLLTVTIMGYFDIYFLSAYNWIAILFAYGLVFSDSLAGK